MQGETDLTMLLAAMQPHLHGSPYVFCSVQQDMYERLPLCPMGMFQEQEGVTLIVTQQQAVAHGLPLESTWACITLTVHSALAAVGFLATITSHLAKANISVNPVSAYYHDHLFVPWERRDQAIAILEDLQKTSAA